MFSKLSLPIKICNCGISFWLLKSMGVKVSRTFILSISLLLGVAGSDLVHCSNLFKFYCIKLLLHNAIYRLRFYSNSLIYILSLSSSHNNVASIRRGLSVMILFHFQIITASCERSLSYFCEVGLQELKRAALLIKPFPSR